MAAFIEGSPQQQGLPGAAALESSSLIEPPAAPAGPLEDPTLQ